MVWIFSNNKEYREAMQGLTHWRGNYFVLKEKYEEKCKEEKEIRNKNRLIEAKFESMMYNEKKLKNKIDKLDSELKNLKWKNFELMGLLNKKNPNWQKIGNRVLRINPITGKPEKYDVPDDFRESDIKKFNISEDKTCITFEYQENPNSSNMKKFEIPTTAGKKIGISNLDELIGKTDIDHINQINSEKDLIKYLKKNDINTNNKNWELVIIFIIIKRDNKFRFEDFEKNCKFGNRETARLYINKLIEIELIKRFKKGVYEVLFNFE